MRVQIVVPGKETDPPAVRRASRSIWGELLLQTEKLWEHTMGLFSSQL